MSDESLLVLIDDEPAVAPAPAASSPCWRVMVIDDDPDVHASTAFALDALQVAGRPIELLHANSAAEGRELLQREADVAVLLLDVVMETEDAGLRLVRAIREELGLHKLRIILRTGQPGQVPELETISRYDINDYKTKGELTRTRLYASLTTAIRSYEQLCRLDASRRGLEQVVAASNQLIAEQGMQALAEGVITQIAGLLGIDPAGLVCASAEASPVGAGPASFVVIAAAGPFRHLMQRRIEDIDDHHIVDCLQRCLDGRSSVVNSHSVTLYFPGGAGQGFAAYLGTRAPLRAVDRHLLELFCSNISLCADNVSLVQRLRELAYVDRQLDLPNRTAFVERLEHAQRSGGLAGQALVLLDVDDFSATNEMLGLRYGDLLLQALAERLKRGLGRRVFIARLGGNAFALLGEEAALNPTLLRGLFDAPLEAGGNARRLTACMGWLRCADDPEAGPVELVEHVIMALKQAKQRGHGCITAYCPALGSSIKQRAQLLEALHQALASQSLFMVYQPQVDLRSQTVVGVEALMRWRTADGSLVPPDRFIPVAEQSGLIVELGRWALHSALQALQALAAAGHEGLQMAVNVSSVQLEQQEFLAELDAALAAFPLGPQRLELELTESVAVIGMERVLPLLTQLRGRGISIAIDDFGTGYSSLSYLDQLPADRIKIDRSFVAQLGHGGRGARIARLIGTLGRQMEMRVVAEGVETPQQQVALMELGCDEAQGYLYARPMELSALIAWLGAR